MSKKQPETALAVIGDRFPALSPSAELQEALAANLGGVQIGLGDLDKIRTPSGGGLAWEIPSISGEPDAAKTFDAIIIDWKPTRAFYRTAFSGEKNPPDCSSDDCVTGHGTPGGACHSCPMAKWGSAANFNAQKKASDSKAQACSERRLLFVLLEGSVLPTMVSLGPTAIAGVKKYMLGLASRGIPFYGVTTRFALSKATAGVGIEYSLPGLQMVNELAADEVARVKAYAEAIRPNLRRLRDDEPVEN